jgi:mono/diheme cytochrome c family protein
MRDLSVSRAGPRRRFDRQAGPRILSLTGAHVLVLACSHSSDGVQNGSVSSDGRTPEAGMVLGSDASMPVDRSSSENTGRSTGLAGDGDTRAGRADEHSDAGSAGASLPCDVAHVLAQHCWQCHGEAPSFGAPMPLTNWEALQRPAPSSQQSTTAEIMLARAQDDVHPMPPAPHARLSAGELQTLTNWVEAGAPRSGETCANVVADGGVDPRQSKPDDCEQTVEFRAHGGRDEGSKFALDAHPVADNQHQCFYFDALYGADQGMLWYEPIVDNQTVLHHWVLYGVDQKTHENATSVPCESPDLGSYTLAAWAPGANNNVVPHDVALTLPSGPNAGLILQLHYYNSSGQVQHDASGIRLCTGAKNSRAHVAAVHMLDNQNICLPPGADTEVAGTCSPRTDLGDIHITGVWPHMHKLGRRMQLTINRVDGTKELIHDMPFDFNAQVFYPQDSVVMHKGDTLETRCHFRNETATQVRFGELTQNEMCVALVTAWPAGALTDAVSAAVGPAGLNLSNRCNDLLRGFPLCR